jgi:hypothetical protein
MAFLTVGAVVRYLLLKSSSQIDRSQIENPMAAWSGNLDSPVSGPQTETDEDNPELAVDSGGASIPDDGQPASAHGLPFPAKLQRVLHPGCPQTWSNPRFVQGNVAGMPLQPVQPRRH